MIITITRRTPCTAHSVEIDLFRGKIKENVKFIFQDERSVRIEITHRTFRTDHSVKIDLL